MMQAARDLIISKEIKKLKKEQGMRSVHEQSAKRRGRASSAMSLRGLEGSGKRSGSD